MPKKPIPNPDFEPWSIQIQKKFIQDAYRLYVRDKGDPSLWYNPKGKYDWSTLTYITYRPDRPHVKDSEYLSWLVHIPSVRADPVSNVALHWSLRRFDRV